MPTPHQYVRHDAGTCPNCSERGHWGCQHPGCTNAARVQWQRHATDAEYAGLPTERQPTDQVLHVPVYVCPAHSPSGEATSIVHVATCGLPDGGCSCTGTEPAPTRPHALRPQPLPAPSGEPGPTRPWTRRRPHHTHQDAT